MKRQRAVITITDQDDGTFRANVCYEPSLKKRTTQSPAVNAAVRLALILTKAGQTLGSSLTEEKPPVVLTDSD